MGLSKKSKANNFIMHPSDKDSVFEAFGFEGDEFQSIIVICGRENGETTLENFKESVGLFRVGYPIIEYVGHFKSC